VGDGPTKLVETIRRTPGCIVHPFVPMTDLPPLYRSADIGVWPKQESTSQVDAAASGLPLILNHRVQVRERIEGNGLTYQNDDSDDLAEQIRSLKDRELRQRMGATGRRRMVEHFDWRHLARRRLADYAAALEPQRLLGRAIDVPRRRSGRRHAGDGTPTRSPLRATAPTAKPAFDCATRRAKPQRD
jgi:glycosyltransferase involved in cell wall biosynthesis